MEKKEFMEVGPALTYLANKGVHRTKETLVAWCKKYGIGHQVGGTKYGAWVVDLKKLDAHLAGVQPMPCPFGYTFGLDFDKGPSCPKCSVWDKCQNWKVYYGQG